MAQNHCLIPKKKTKSVFFQLMEHFICLSLELLGKSPKEFECESALFSIFTGLIIRTVCFGEEDSSAGNSAPGENLVNCER